MPIRFDVGRIDGPKISDNGYLKAEAYPTRAGIFLYMNMDGTVRRELRHPDHVFNTESLATLAEIPMTNTHPKEPLNASNTRKYAVGFTGPTPQKDSNDMIKTTVTVFDDQTISEVVSGEKVELSCGYFCDVEFTPGVWNGQQYDAIQKNIRYNHLACVQEGRAGPDAKVKLDSMRTDAKDEGFAVMVTDSTEKSSSQKTDVPVVSLVKEDLQQQPLEKIMPAKIKIDSVEYEIADIALAQVITAKVDAGIKAADQFAAAGKEVEVLKGKCDVLEADLKKKDDEIAALKSVKISDKELIAKADALVKVRDFGKKILGETAKVDEMEIDSIKKSVVVKLLPNVKVDEKTKEYVDAAFDMQLSLDSASAGDPVRKAIEDRAREGGVKGGKEARAARIKNDTNAWQGYTGAGSKH